jgi:tellurite resistance protein TehA-like permease
MKPTRIPELAATLVVVAVVVYLLVKPSYSALPALPTLAGVTLLVLAAIEVVLGFALKARIERRPGTKPVEPLVAARAVALAKASAVAGAVMGGVWLGMLGYLLPRRTELAAAADDTPGAVVGLACALALVAAALWLQHCCRAPSDSDDQDRDRQR